MRVKKFTAETHARAMAQVKRELGKDALILSSRSLEEDFINGGSGHHHRVEITAAIDSSPHKVESEMDKKPNANAASNLLEEAADLDLKSLLFSLLSQTERAQTLGLKPHQFEIYSQMVESGMDERVASKILERAASAIPGETFNKNAEMRQLTDLMERVLVCRGPIQLVSNKPKTVALVGPTGAGKTTTIAKIAADFVYRQNKKVALVSLDTFRIGAVDQLRLYGDIMEVPVEMAFDAKDFSDIVRRHADKDVILVDTMGRSHKDHAYSGQLREIFRGAGRVETHLVLDVGTQEKLYYETYRQFSTIGIDRVLFTKLDEGLSFGQIFNFALRTRVPFSYFTMGQRVPEDIEIARQDRVIRLIFN